MQVSKTITAKEFTATDTSAALVVDIRTDMEYAEKHLCRPHLHIPFDDMLADKLAAYGKSTPIYLVCASGRRAEKARDMFVAKQYQNIIVVDGGLGACASCGEKTNSFDNFNPITLERQVRIAAGVIIIIGALLSFLNMLFMIIPLGVGCGLVFAGITNRCGLALLLTRAPWNKTLTTRST